MKGSMNRKRVEEVREAKTKLEAEKKARAEAEDAGEEGGGKVDLRGRWPDARVRARRRGVPAHLRGLHLRCGCGVPRQVG